MNSRQMLLCVGFGMAFLFVWEQLQSVRLGYRLEQIHSQVRDQEDKNAYLRLELERLHSPQALAQAAQKRLSMTPPNPESLTILERPETAPRARKSFWLLSRLFTNPNPLR